MESIRGLRSYSSPCKNSYLHVYVGFRRGRYKPLRYLSNGDRNPVSGCGFQGRETNVLCLTKLIHGVDDNIAL